MRLAIPARGLTREFSGPNEFIRGLIGGILHYAPAIDLHVYADDPKIAQLFPDAHVQILPVHNRLVWDHFLLPLALKRDRIEIAIFPKGPLSVFHPPKSIAIFHDLGYFYPALNAYRALDTLYMRIALSRAAKDAWKIFTVSETTREDVIHLLKVNPEKIVTIHEAPSDLYRPITDTSFLNNVQQRYHLHMPFIFYPTSISPRKNIGRLLEAFEGLKNAIPHHLYLTGGLKWKSDEVLKRLETLKDRVHLLGTVPAQDMPALYALAEFTIYPSLFEGFGLPIVEAFRCGSPVMTSNVTSLPEVAGDAALLVDPYDVNSIREGLLEMAKNSDLRTHLREKGFERARLFTWENTVRTISKHLS